MWEVKDREGCGQEQAGTGNPAKQTKVMCQQPKNGDSGPRLGSGTAPGRLQEAEMKLQAWCESKITLLPAQSTSKQDGEEG